MKKRSLKWKSGYARIFSRHPSHSILRNKILTKLKVYIRFGSLTETKGRRPDIEINTVQSIINTMNKLTMKRLFRTAKVRSPVFYELSTTGVSYLDKDSQLIILTDDEFVKQASYPLIAKLMYRSRGQGMKKLANGS